MEEKTRLRVNWGTLRDTVRTGWDGGRSNQDEVLAAPFKLAIASISIVRSRVSDLVMVIANSTPALNVS